MEIQILSRELIKPSSPTPPHLTNFPISFLDHITFRNYVPLLFFYNNHDTKFSNQTSKISHLKKSLSKVLSIYYPFAGRFKNQLFIECNDQGVLFHVATIVGTKLSTILHNPTQNLLDPLFPNELQWKKMELNENILVIQINCFSCGGIVISVCACHKIIDAATAFNFINDWAKLNRKEEDEEDDEKNSKLNSTLSLPENFLYAGDTIFPHKNLPNFREVEFVIDKTIVCKRFVLEGSKIDSLKVMMVNSQSREVKIPTRVEVVTALIYKCVVSSLGLNFETTSLRMAVDLRRRMVNLLSDKGVGNLVWFLFVFNPKMDELVLKIRQGLCEFCEVYPKKFGGKEKDTSFIFECLKQVTNPILESNDNINNNNQSLIMYASWCKFPMYEADFGWGRPIWVTTSACPVKNAIVLMDTKDGDGIEVIVNMKQSDMVKFESNVELLQYASLNPSIVG